MVRISEVLGLALISAGLTAALGAAQARDARSATTTQASVAAPVVSPEDKAELGQATAAKIVDVPACARQVKVVYAGYGEQGRASCRTPAQ